MLSGYGWFLEKVFVEDVLRATRYEITCNRWLSHQESDGLTVRHFDVTAESIIQAGVKRLASTCS